MATAKKIKGLGPAECTAKKSESPLRQAAEVVVGAAVAITLAVTRETLTLAANLTYDVLEWWDRRQEPGDAREGQS